MGTSAVVIRGVYDALTKGNLPTVLGAFDGKIEWREAEGFLYEDGNPYVGPQAVEGLLQRAVGDVEQFEVVPTTFIEAGDTIVVEGRYKGTVRATGLFVDAQFAHVWQLQDGKVISFQQYTDTAQWRRAAGA